MVMSIKLYFGENNEKLNIVVSDDIRNKSTESLKPITDIVVPLTHKSKSSSDGTVLSVKATDNSQFPTTIDISNVPNIKSETVKNEPLEEYYIIEKVVGKRYNSVTDQVEFLLRLKPCVPICNPWTPVSEPVPISFQENSLLYVQKPRMDIYGESNRGTGEDIPQKFQKCEVKSTEGYPSRHTTEDIYNKAQCADRSCLPGKLSEHPNCAESKDHGEWTPNSFTSGHVISTSPYDQKSTVNGHPKNSRKKRNACLYCQELRSELYEHYIIKHPEEKEVQVLLSFPKHSKERRMYLNLMHGKANRNYNKMVSNKQEGELIFKRWNNQTEDDAKCLIPCGICNHSYVKTNMNRHLRECTRKYTFMNEPESCDTIAVPRISTEMVNPISVILFCVNEGEIKEFIRDPLIQHYLKSYFKNPYDEFKKKEIIQDIRYLWRYLFSFQKVSASDNFSLEDCFKASNVGYIVNAFHLFSNNYTHPDQVERLGNCLMNVYKMLCTSDSIKQDKKSFQTSRRSFGSIWRTAIRPEIMTARTRIAKNIHCAFPSLDLIHEISEFINKYLQILISSEIISYSAYKTLCCFLIAKISLLNYETGIDLSSMTLNEFQNRTTFSSAEFSNVCGPTAYEALIGENLVVLISENGTKNVAILTYDIIQGIEKIISIRNIVEIPNEAVHVFACRRQQMKPMHYTMGLRFISGLIDREQVSLLSAANIQKYISVQMQWFNMNEEQRLRWSRYLSHVMNVGELLPPKIFSVIPVILMAIDENIQINKPLHEITEDDTREFVRQCCGTRCEYLRDEINAEFEKQIATVYLDCNNMEFATENEDSEDESIHNVKSEPVYEKLESANNVNISTRNEDISQDRYPCNIETVPGCSTNSEYTTSDNCMEYKCNNETTFMVQRATKRKNENSEEFDSPQTRKRIRWTQLHKKIVESRFPEVLLDPTATVTERKLIETVEELQNNGLTVRKEVLRTMIYNNYQKPYRNTNPSPVGSQNTTVNYE